MAIEDLTGQLKMLKAHGTPDLQFSERARVDYTHLIGDCRRVLIEQSNACALAANLGYVGEYLAVNRTKVRLEENATGIDGIRDALDQSIEYLNAFEDAVNAAFKRVQAEDQS